ncbi:MAG: hypothetical protein LBR79_04445, partial [Oscillospiraceae bacterium]|nr:hypothetical protein [Oscillospiraceae bacterium]
FPILSAPTYIEFVVYYTYSLKKIKFLNIFDIKKQNSQIPNIISIVYCKAEQLYIAIPLDIYCEISQNLRINHEYRQLKYSYYDLKQFSKVNLFMHLLPAVGWEKVIKIKCFSNETAIVNPVWSCYKQVCFFGGSNYVH